MKISRKDALTWFRFFAELPADEPLGCRQREIALSVFSQIHFQFSNIIPYSLNDLIPRKCLGLVFTYPDLECNDFLVIILYDRLQLFKLSQELLSLSLRF